MCDMKNKNYTKQFIGFLFIFVFLCMQLVQTGFVLASSDDDKDTELTEEEKQKIEEKKDEYEEKQEKLEKKVKKEQKKKAQLQNQLGSVNQVLGQTKRTINDVVNDIEKKEEEIERHDAQIATLNKQAMLYKSSLADTIRRFYYAGSGAVSLSAIVENDGNHRFLDSTDALDDMREKIVDTVQQVEQTKQMQQQKKEELAELKKEKEKLLAEHKQKESELLSQASAVQVEMIKVDTSIAQLNEKLDEVESKLSSLLGESFSTDDIREAAKFASKKTGVRKSFILGMLVVETNLGRYTGGCTYKKSKMGDKNAKIFKRITKDLGYNYKKVKVSCPLSYGIGGAMGVAQFMPTTWVGYEKKIEKYTGHSPADPWSLTDGVMAMAIKLANDGATSKKGEFDAARRYYCGSRLDRKECINYGNKVLYWAENYKDRL
jgi:membrane-bound lytic murein transglycosylase B